MKINTYFGTQETKIKRQFDVAKEKFCIIDFPFKYMNAEEPVNVKTVVHYKTGQVIYHIKAQRRETLKSFLIRAEEAVQNLLSLRGEKEFKAELDKFETINEH